MENKIIEIQISKEMIDGVLNAMVLQIKERGASNKMVSLERIERQLYESGTTFFIPVRNTLSALIKKGVVTYFIMGNGKLVFGLSKKSQGHFMPEMVINKEGN